MSLCARGNSVGCGSYTDFTGHFITMSRPDQYNFPHLQLDDRCWVSFYIPQLTSSKGADPQTGRIFATPSVILRSAGSVGVALVMWLFGAVVAATGSAVYLEYGTVSVVSPLRTLTYRNGATDSTPERRREELPRICLQTSQVYGDVCLCYE